MKFKSKLFLLSIALCAAVVCHSQQVISISNGGSPAGSSKDIVPTIQKILNANKGKSNLTISFEKGRYDFYPQPKTNIAFDIDGFDGLTIDGNGSEFIFHGTCRIAVINNCSDITFENFSIDWQRPFTSQGTIVRSTNKYLDVKIDHTLYPYVIEDNKIYFTGEDWKKPALSSFNNLYDKDTKEIVYNTWDSPLGTIFEQKAQSLGNDVVRFYGKTDIKPEPGTFVAIYTDRHSDQTGIYATESKNITFRNLRLYYALNIGFLAQHCENVTMDNACCAVNEDKNRVFSSESDNAHINNCRGLIRMVNCSPTGMGDDAINVHGRYFEIIRIINRKQVEIKLQDARIATGEELWFVDGKTSQRGEIRTVAKQHEEQYNGEYSPCVITFKGNIPSSVSVGDYLESKTWTASVEISNCTFAKKNRARGVLVTTPKKVEIKNNHFSTAGCSILIEGGINKWNESGGMEDAVIEGNVFDNCLTSGNKHGNSGEWGDAIITINPSAGNGNKAYHKNISIIGNTFNVFDAPIISASSVDSLTFQGNSISHTDSYKPYSWQKKAFKLSQCKNVSIRKNTWSNYPAQNRGIIASNMQREDIADTDSGFEITSGEVE